MISQRLLSREVQDYINDHNRNWIRVRLFHDRSRAGHPKFSFIIHLCPEFPETPWQKILSDARKSRLSELPNLEKEIYRPIKESELRGLARDPSSDRFEDFISLHEQPREFAVVPLDPDLSDAALTEIFGHFLKYRTKSAAAKKASGRRNSPMDGLHALGALRLRRYYGSSAKVMAAIHDRLVQLPYSDDAAVRAAVRRAESILAKF